MVEAHRTVTFEAADDQDAPAVAEVLDGLREVAVLAFLRHGRILRPTARER